MMIKVWQVFSVADRLKSQISLSFFLFVHNENSKTAQTILAYSLVSILRANLDHVLGTSQKSTKKGLTLLGIFSVIESLYDELYLHHAILFA